VSSSPRAGVACSAFTDHSLLVVIGPRRRCMDDIGVGAILPCCHLYCAPCIRRWIVTNPTCVRAVCPACNFARTESRKEGICALHLLTNNRCFRRCCYGCFEHSILTCGLTQTRAHPDSLALGAQAAAWCARWTTCSCCSACARRHPALGPVHRFPYSRRSCYLCPRAHGSARVLMVVLLLLWSRC
jgi:hypothetical protein